MSIFTRISRRSLLLLAVLLLPLLIATATLAAPPSGKGGGGKGGGGDDGGGDPGAAYPVDYEITLLGTLGGDESVPKGMNNHSEVVGYSETDRPYSFVDPETDELVEGSWRHGFLYADLGDGPQMHDLQDLFEDQGIVDPFDYEGIEGWYVQSAQDINDSGQIVGKMAHIQWVTVAGGSRPKQTETMVFRYTPGSAQPLEELTGLPGGQGFIVEAMSNVGEVVGYAADEAGMYHAVVWTQAGAPTDLGIFADRNTYAFDVNDAGEVCGGNNFRYHAWRHTPGIGFEDLGVGFKKRNASSAAHSINNLGQVAGESGDGQFTVEAFRYTDGVGLQRLGTLGGTSSYCNHTGTINNAGDVVGYSNTFSGNLHVFLYTDEHGMADLEAAIVNLPEDLSGQIRRWLQVNDAGAVCGGAGDGFATQPSLQGRTYEAFLLTPIP
jgi:probable HAF family extracellular repeat protein